MAFTDNPGTVRLSHSNIDAGRKHDTALAVSRGPLLAVTALYVLFVVYGSLVPLNFTPMPLSRAWEAFHHIRYLQLGIGSRADWVANGVLYFPVGLLATSLLTTSKRAALPRASALLAALVFSFVLAVSVEFTQLFFPPRTVSLNDVIAECLGSILGGLVGARWPSWPKELAAAVAGHPERLTQRLLESYAIAYLAFSLFPFDFLVSWPEVEWKVLSDSWGWAVAKHDTSTSIAIPLAKLFAEVLAAMPFGVILRRSWPTSGLSSPAGAFICGAVLGTSIELAQFFTASGVSQGISVLTRAIGVWAGVVAWRNVTRMGPSGVAALVRRFKVPLGIAYLLGLVTVNGWFEHRWKGVDFALRSLDQLHFLPLYYHYYTTEQAALLSLTATLLMYAPVGILAWATWASPGSALVIASVIAALVEASKLCLEGLHPDTTNIVIAGLAAWSSAKLAKRLTRRSPISPHIQSGQSSAAERPVPAPERRPYPEPGTTSIFASSRQGGTWSEKKTDTLSRSHLTGLSRAPLSAWPALILVLALVAWWVATFPVMPILIGLALVAYASLIWWRPHLLLVAIAGALPVLDLAPLTGRFYLDEFDILLAVSVAIGYVRLPPAPQRVSRDMVLLTMTALVGVACLLGAIRGLLPWQMPDGNAFNNYYSPYNAIRLAKGVLWVLLICRLRHRFAASGQDVRRLFARGAIIGLACAVAVIVWERVAFPGLLNFADSYRVTGPFSQMHIGGADMECFLTVAAPFLIVMLLHKRTWTGRFVGLLVLVATTYSVMVTFSRAAYAGYGMALGLVVMAMLVKLARQSGTEQLKTAGAAVMLLVFAGLVAVPILLGSFAQQRISLAGADLGVRQDHWADALQMRDHDWATQLLGMGFGRYPQTHFWRSSEIHAATYQFSSETDSTFLRLGSGSPLYIEQFVAVKPHHEYLLSLDARGNRPNTQVNLTLCEKWLLTSMRCSANSIMLAQAGIWQRFTVRVASGDIGGGPWYAARPAKLSLYNPSVNSIADVSNVQLIAEDGKQLLANGYFSQGLDDWFFSVDNDKPWHIWSLPVAVLFDLGWLGLVTISLLLVLALWRAGRGVWLGDPMAGGLLASLAGCLVVGSLNSLIDSPRMILLIGLLSWLCCQSTTPTKAVSQA
jgi:glycopeptide antibiotics resistance protein